MSLPKLVFLRPSARFQKPDPFPTKTHNGASVEPVPRIRVCPAVSLSSHPWAFSVPRPPTVCHFLNYLCRPWLLRVAWSWLWGLEVGRVGSLVPWTELGRLAGGLGLGTLILSMCSLVVKAWRTRTCYLPDSGYVFSALCRLEACPRGQHFWAPPPHYSRDHRPGHALRGRLGTSLPANRS